MECSCDGHPNWKVLISEVSCSPLRRSQQSSLNTELKPSLRSNSLETAGSYLGSPGDVTCQTPLATHVLLHVPNREPQPGAVCVLNNAEQKPWMKRKTLAQRTRKNLCCEWYISVILQQHQGSFKKILQERSAKHHVMKRQTINFPWLLSTYLILKVLLRTRNTNPHPLLLTEQDPQCGTAFVTHLRDTNILFNQELR